VSLPKPSALTASTFAYVTFPAIAATRVGATSQIVPLRKACGRYVQWFQTQ